MIERFNGKTSSGETRSNVSQVGFRIVKVDARQFYFGYEIQDVSFTQFMMVSEGDPEQRT